MHQRLPLQTLRKSSRNLLLKLIQHLLRLLKRPSFNGPYNNKIPSLEVLLLLLLPQPLNLIHNLLNNPLKLGILPTMHVQLRQMYLRD